MKNKMSFLIALGCFFLPNWSGASLKLFGSSIPDTVRDSDLEENNRDEFSEDDTLSNIPSTPPMSLFKSTPPRLNESANLHQSSQQLSHALARFTESLNKLQKSLGSQSRGWFEAVEEWMPTTQKKEPKQKKYEESAEKIAKNIEQQLKDLKTELRKNHQAGSLIDITVKNFQEELKSLIALAAHELHKIHDCISTAFSENPCQKETIEAAGYGAKYAGSAINLYNQALKDIAKISVQWHHKFKSQTINQINQEDLYLDEYKEAIADINKAMKKQEKLIGSGSPSGLSHAIKGYFYIKQCVESLVQAEKLTTEITTKSTHNNRKNQETVIKNLDKAASNWREGSIQFSRAIDIQEKINDSRFHYFNKNDLVNNMRKLSARLAKLAGSVSIAWRMPIDTIKTALSLAALPATAALWAGKQYINWIVLPTARMLTYLYEVGRDPLEVAEEEDNRLTEQFGHQEDDSSGKSSGKGRLQRFAGWIKDKTKPNDSDDFFAGIEEKEKEEDWDEETTPLDGIIKSIAKQSTIEKLLSELNSNYEQIKRILQKMHAGDRQNDAVEVLNAIKYALERINVSAHSDSARLSKIKDYAQKIENLGIYGKETTGWFAGWGDNDLKKVNREIIKIIDAMSAKNSAWLYLDILTTNNEETFLKSFNVTQLNNSSKKKIATQKLFLIMHGVAGSILKNSAMANMWNEIHREELILKQAITHLEKITTDTATATTLRTLINHIDKAIKSYDTHAVGKDQQTQQGLFQNAITEIRHACDQIIKITKSHLSQHG